MCSFRNETLQTSPKATLNYILSDKTCLFHSRDLALHLAPCCFEVISGGSVTTCAMPYRKYIQIYHTSLFYYLHFRPGVLGSRIRDPSGALSVTWVPVGPGGEKKIYLLHTRDLKKHCTSLTLVCCKCTTKRVKLQTLLLITVSVLDLNA